MKIEIPENIWVRITDALPWAKEQPDNAVVFLLGMAIGTATWLKQPDIEEVKTHE